MEQQLGHKSNDAEQFVTLPFDIESDHLQTMLSMFNDMRTDVTQEITEKDLKRENALLQMTTQFR